MDIEGRSFHVDGSKVHHEAFKRTFKLLLQAIFTTGEPNEEVTFGKMKIKRGTNPRGLSCITLTNVEIDREVLDALGKSLEQLLGPAFFLLSTGDTRLRVNDDYQSLLDTAVREAQPRSVKR